MSTEAAPTPVAAAPAPVAAPTPVAAASNEPWYHGASTENTGWIQNKGYKTSFDLMDAARNMEKLIGLPADRVIKTPEKFRDDAGLLTKEGREVYEKYFDAPKEAKDYDLEVPKEFGDANQAELFRKLFYEEGVSKSTAAKLVKGFNEYQAGLRKGVQDQAELEGKNADAILKRDWGQAYDQNVNIAKEAIRTFGLDQKIVDSLHQAMGQEKTFKLLHQFGSSVGEGKFVRGGATNGPLEPSAALHQISALKADAGFAKKFAMGDAESVQKWTKLHEQAYPGQFSVGPTMI
ncbi:MAG: hypothetical protein ABI351_02400 [Herbaspirillum sp.]